MNVDVAMNTEIKRKMQFSGKVKKISLAGAVLDIGVDQPAVLHISQLPQEDDQPIKRVEDVLEVGQEVDVWVKKVKDDHIELTMIKPLDLEWREIKSGMTVKGKVVRIEKFGVFVEIGAERPGLIHISELAHGYVRTPSEVVKEGEEIEAQVLEVNRRKKQIKLSLKAMQPEPEEIMEEIKRDEQAAEKKKPARRKKSRKDDSGQFVDESVLAETAQESAEPTAMEIAMRDAMERAKQRKQDDKARKSKEVSKEQEDIIARTLEHKNKASSG